MRQEFIDDPDHEMTDEQIRDAAPWLAEYRECGGGWLAFESVTDAELWDRS